MYSKGRLIKHVAKSLEPIKKAYCKRIFSDFVKIVEVGPRDGLQNEEKIVPTATKIDFINKLSETGLKSIEVTSFVSPKWIPQMRDNAELFQAINKKPDVSYPVLVPNLKGLDSALKVNAKEIAIFGAASESFSQKNTNCSIADGIKKFSQVVGKAKEHNLKVRGYVSCVVGCPYEGDIKPSVVANVIAAMLNLGCYEISLGDTVGVGTPKKIQRLFNDLKHLSSGNMSEFAIHCHDTYGQALVNISTSLDCGVRVIDSSVAGLGGCPYAAGASGNVATEDVVYFLHGEGMETGLDLNKLANIGNYISNELGRKNQSRAGSALFAKQQKKLEKSKL